MMRLEWSLIDIIVALNLVLVSIPMQRHAEAEEFYDLLNATSQPIWHRCQTHSKLLLAVRMLSIKFDYNVTHACFDVFMDILREVAPPGSRILVNYY